MSRRTKLLIGIAFGILVAIAAIAPFTLMLVPNPKPVAVTNLAQQPVGVYIETAGRTYHVFAFADQPDSFPAGSIVTSARPVVWVRTQMPSDASAYTISKVDGGGQSGAAIDVVQDSSHAGLLAMRPKAALAPGQYVAAVARDDLFGGTDYAYFSVVGSASAEGK
jgi:hypothetical protein